MESVPKPEQTSCKNSGYLPHHAVITEGTTGSSKLRVVFDGSAKSNGASLNDILLKRAQIQQDLFSIVTRFKTHKVVFTADISKMYWQILIHKQDRDLQRIIWRFDATQPLQIYRLKTVTYGTTSAPYLATRSLHQLATDEGIHFPLARLIVINDFYVDDVLTGANSESETLVLRDQLINLLKRGGFELNRWASNSPSSIPRNNLVNNIQNLDKDCISKTLGIFWNSFLDTILYSVKPNFSVNKITKRMILSVIAKLFDPLGLEGPVLINAKIILQILWSLKVDWDKKLPTELQSKRINFVQNLSKLNVLKILRRVISIENPTSFEIHGFSDASESAYGACVYLRAINVQSNNTSTHLMCAKSRVAPLKALSLSRLELCTVNAISGKSHCFFAINYQ